MYVEITSCSELFDSRGKRTFINSRPESVTVRAGGAEHLGEMPWHVEVSAIDFHDYGPTHPSGDVKKSTLIHLTPEDVQGLLTALGAHGLLKVGVSLEALTTVHGLLPQARR